ncbi:hypothetical protein BP00DRAFT_157751 [Aspergillus indologenus CBS 114.80]|uniref:Uncharacterized protein n=1 Tax=Aspergillus indologenus CBS 114.80 TaxID=1450541 RepID=A0A2V5IDZ8_9EURO|nr:hypothetical protein BP00DRAFT_157751 [Aspergillus indologenus CBS 114.80]
MKHQLSSLTHSGMNAQGRAGTLTSANWFFEFGAVNARLNTFQFLSLATRFGGPNSRLHFCDFLGEHSGMLAKTLGCLSVDHLKLQYINRLVILFMLETPATKSQEHGMVHLNQRGFAPGIEFNFPAILQPRTWERHQRGNECMMSGSSDFGVYWRVPRDSDAGGEEPSQ